MTETQLETLRYGCTKKGHRARLLYCMDYLMHNLNDEEALEPWLADGPPDGLHQESENPPAEAYETLDLSDDAFEAYLSKFVRILARECMPDLPDLNQYRHERAALC